LFNPHLSGIIASRLYENKNGFNKLVIALITSPSGCPAAFKMAEKEKRVTEIGLRRENDNGHKAVNELFYIKRRLCFERRLKYRFIHFLKQYYHAITGVAYYIVPG